jgi:DNA-binding PucR family transcriptional regulator
MGLAASAPHIGLVVFWQSETTTSNRQLETLISRVVSGHRLLSRVWLRGSEVVILLAVKEVDPIDQAFDVARAIRFEVRHQYPGAPIAIGIGRPARDVLAWPASYHDALKAAQVASKLISETSLFFGDLGVYRLLAQLEEGNELGAFCDELLGGLIAYDRKQGTQLIDTLEAFFACHGKLSKTARHLHIHRNTLLYRLERIHALSTIDLENEESRLATHLALKVRRFLAGSR